MTPPYSPLVFKMTQDSRAYNWDKLCKGLAVRYNKNGTASYIVRYSLKGRDIWKTIAPVSALALSEAREMAHRMRSLASSGQDPSTLLCLEQSSISKNSGITFGQFAEIYIERHAREHNKSWKKSQQRIACYLQEWLNRPLYSITNNEVAALHQKVGKKSGPYAANRLRQQLSVMFNFAIRWGYLPKTAINPAKWIKDYPEISRDRFITPDEMPRLFKVLNEYPRRDIQAAIKLYLLTGFRTSELLKLRWDQVDFSLAEVRLIEGQTKSGRKHYLPLAPEAIEILKVIPRQEGNPYIFPGRWRKTHLSRIDRDWRRIAKEAGIPDVRPHDLRRTCGSWICRKTGNLALIGEILNQTQERTTEVYSRFLKKDVREALDDYAKTLSQYF